MVSVSEAYKLSSNLDSKTCTYKSSKVGLSSGFFVILFKISCLISSGVLSAPPLRTAFGFSLLISGAFRPLPTMKIKISKNKTSRSETKKEFYLVEETGYQRRAIHQQKAQRALLHRRTCQNWPCTDSYPDASKSQAPSRTNFLNLDLFTVNIVNFPRHQTPNQNEKKMKSTISTLIPWRFTFLSSRKYF